MPLAFYEALKSQQLTGIGGDGPSTQYRKGIYGRFLCNLCEAKFNIFDSKAIGVIKQARWTKEVDKVGILAIENAVLHRTNLHAFALSLLWRAATCQRKEYEGIRLGGYQEILRRALLTGRFCPSLVEATGLYFQEFRGGPADPLNQIFIPYRLRERGGAFEKTFGRFRRHIFGFPHGELLVRLGGVAPRQGFVNIALPTFTGAAALWTSNLSSAYPHLLFARMESNSTVLGYVLSKSGQPLAKGAT